MASNDTVYVRVLDSRGIVEGDRYYGEGDTLEMSRVRFEILRRAVKVEEIERPKAKTKQGK